MARASGLLTLLPLLWAASAGAAEPELCAGGPAAREGSYVVLVDREHPLVVDLDDRGATRTVAIKGRLCDRSRRPLALRLELWRFEGELPRAGEAPTADDFAAGAALEPLQQWSLRSSAAGVFTATGLAPGRYAIVPDWQGIAPRQQYLLLEIEVFPGFDTAAPVHDGGSGAAP